MSYNMSSAAIAKIRERERKQQADEIARQRQKVADEQATRATKRQAEAETESTDAKYPAMERVISLAASRA